MTVTITLTKAQAKTVLRALGDAADARRDPPPAFACTDCAEEYAALAGQLDAALDTQPAAGPGPVSEAAVRAAVAATYAGGGGGLWNLAGTGPEPAALEARKHIIRAALTAGATVNGDHQ